MLIPQSGQAKSWENIFVLLSSPKIETNPSLKFRAFSMASERRARSSRVSDIFILSIIISTVCFFFLSIFINFGNSSDGRAGIMRSCFLVDGDSRREAINRIYIRLVHSADELAGIGG